MRYGLSLPNIGDPDLLLEMGVEAEGHGWDGFFLWDHIRMLKDVPVPVLDPWVLLGALAVRTERVRLGTMVTPIPRRRPTKLARETVTLDHLSRGRLTLGVGLGFPPDADFELIGEDPDERVRAAKLDEGLEVLTRLWTGEEVTFEGEHFRIRSTRFLPAPLQRPRIPIWVAGCWPIRAPFRRAARWDGVYPLALRDGEIAPPTPDEIRAIVAFVVEHRAGSEPFDVVAFGSSRDHADVAPHEEAGATWWMESDEGYPGWEERVVERIRGGPPG